MFLPFDDKEVLDLSYFTEGMVYKDKDGIYVVHIPKEKDAQIKLEAFERKLIINGFYKADYKYFKREIHVQNIERRRRKLMRER